MGRLRAPVNVTLIALMGLMATADVAEAQVLLPSLAGPYYARLERGAVLQTDEWVAIAFYRDPSCVPAQFNLLNFFDFSAIPGIFTLCPTTSGFEIWGDPATDPAPRQSVLQGSGAVPIWFVSVEDFQNALPGLTVPELLAMPSLMQGVATFYRETLHPLGGAVRNSLEIVATGYVPDGRLFRFIAIEAAGSLRHVSIEFH